MNRIKIIILGVFLTLFFLEAKSQNKLITIYDKNCAYCDDLLNKTFKDTLVIQALKKYKHLLYEKDSLITQELIKKYDIKVFPTQIFVLENEEIIIEAYQNIKQELAYLDNPKISKALVLKMRSEEEDFIPQQFVKLLCLKIDMSKKAGKDPYQEFLIALEKISTKYNFSIENIEKYAFDNIDKIVCRNNDEIKLREYSSLLKYALDTRNYIFLRNVILIKQDGGNVCNPYIDYNRIEKIEGENESLLEFFDKILANENSTATHSIGTVENLKMRVEGCIKNNQKK